MKQRIVFPYDELGVCNWGDVTLLSQAFNGLGNKLITDSPKYKMSLNLDTDTKMKKWYDFFTLDLNNGTKPFLLNVPTWGEGRNKLVVIVKGSLEAEKTEEGWEVAFKVASFPDGGYVYDENGVVVTADVPPEPVTNASGEIVTDTNGIVVTAPPICQNDVVDANGEIVTDAAGDPVTAPGTCQELVTVEPDCGAKQVKYKGDRVGDSGGLGCGACDDYLGTFNRCFEPDNPLLDKHLALVYKPYEGEHMFAYYKLDGNLYNHLAPEDMICGTPKYNGIGDDINHSYIDSRFKQGLQLDAGYGYFIVQSFPFVYHHSALSLWVYDDTLNATIFKARPADISRSLVTLSIATSGVSNQTKTITIGGEYLLTAAIAETTIKRYIGVANWFHIMVVFNRNYTVSVFINGRDRTTQTGILGHQLNTGDSFAFEAPQSFKIDEVRFLHHKAFTEESARRIYHSGIRSTDFFKDNALGMMLVRMPKPGVSGYLYTCCKRFYIEEYGGLASHRSEDSPFISDGLYKSYSHKGRLIVYNTYLPFRDFTFSAWTKTSAYDGDASPNSHPFQVQCGGLYLWIRNGEIQVTSAGGGSADWARAPQTGKLNTWEMYSFTISSTGATRIYVNGLDVTITEGLQHSTTDIPTFDILSTTKDLGRTCKFAQIRYFNRVLTTDEMIKLYDEHRSWTHW